MALEHPFMSKWLTRLRKDLLRSGSLTELSLYLAKTSSLESNPEKWKLTIRSILDSDYKPDSDFILAVDQWITQRGESASRKQSLSDEQLDLL